MTTTDLIAKYGDAYPDVRWRPATRPQIERLELALLELVTASPSNGGPS